jgi:hypothetical protein
MLFLYRSREHFYVVAQFSNRPDRCQAVAFVGVHQDDPERDRTRPYQRYTYGVDARNVNELLGRVPRQHGCQLCELIPLGHLSLQFYDAS